jgi:primosomal protein N' (replication factor Y)
VDFYAVVTPIPAVPSLDALTYRVPDALRSAVVPGARVLVPLGRRRVTGLVTALGGEPPADVVCRDVGAVLDEEPILNASVLSLLGWMAEYYAAPVAEAVSLAVGRGLTGGSKRFVHLVDAAQARSDI